MTMKQRDLLDGLKHQAQALESQLFHLQYYIRTMEEILVAESIPNRQDFTDEEINRLLRLNQCLAKLEHQLITLAEGESTPLDARITDPDDRLNDYQIDAKLKLILREDDPAFNHNEFNLLTQRTLSLKHLDWTQLGDGKNHRKADEVCPGRLSEVSHCCGYFTGSAIAIRDLKGLR